MTYRPSLKNSFVLMILFFCVFCSAGTASDLKSETRSVENILQPDPDIPLPYMPIDPRVPLIFHSDKPQEIDPRDRLPEYDRESVIVRSYEQNDWRTLEDLLGPDLSLTEEELALIELFAENAEKTAETAGTDTAELNDVPDLSEPETAVPDLIIPAENDWFTVEVVPVGEADSGDTVGTDFSDWFVSGVD